MTDGINFAFLHGGGQGSWVWRETISALDRQTGGKFGRALTLDVPGCGKKRGRDTKDIAFGAIVDELIADLEEARMTDVVLVGHSQAGTAMAHMVEKRPDLFRRLVYVTCSIPLPGQTVIDMIGDGVHGSDENKVGWPVDFKTTGARERAEIMFCNDMGESEATNFMTRLGGDQWPSDAYAATNWQLSQLDKVPASYVLCLRDNILPVTWQETFAGRFHAEEIVRIDAGHQVMNTRPHALAEVLLLEAGRA